MNDETKAAPPAPAPRALRGQAEVAAELGALYGGLRAVDCAALAMKTFAVLAAGFAAIPIDGSPNRVEIERLVERAAGLLRMVYCWAEATGFDLVAGGAMVDPVKPDPAVARRSLRLVGDSLTMAALDAIAAGRTVGLTERLVNARRWLLNMGMRLGHDVDALARGHAAEGGGP